MRTMSRCLYGTQTALLLYFDCTRSMPLSRAQLNMQKRKALLFGSFSDPLLGRTLMTVAVRALASFPTTPVCCQTLGPVLLEA